jgi:hypothetical protein
MLLCSKCMKSVYLKRILITCAIVLTASSAADCARRDRSRGIVDQLNDTLGNGLVSLVTPNPLVTVLGSEDPDLDFYNAAGADLGRMLALCQNNAERRLAVTFWQLMCGECATTAGDAAIRAVVLTTYPAAFRAFLAAIGDVPELQDLVSDSDSDELAPADVARHFAGSRVRASARPYRAPAGVARPSESADGGIHLAWNVVPSGDLEEEEEEVEGADAADVVTLDPGSEDDDLAVPRAAPAGGVVASELPEAAWGEIVSVDDHPHAPADEARHSEPEDDERLIGIPFEEEEEEEVADTTDVDEAASSGRLLDEEANPDEAANLDGSGSGDSDADAERPEMEFDVDNNVVDLL